MHHHLQLALEAIDRTTNSLSTDALNLRPPGKWSIAEILEHLTLSYRRGAAGFAKVAESGEPRATRPTFSQSLGRILIVDVAYFPKAKAPEPTTPTGSIPAESVRESARAALLALDKWRKFHWRHTVHHMGQVKSLLALPGR